jgi:hypothetical protein
VDTRAPAAEDSSVAINNVETPQARKPCAVSRKKTSSVWTVTHRVRSRPARYPPSTEASNWTTVTHTMVDTPAAVPEIPSLAQGETTARPSPVPSTNNTSDSTAAPTAPANIAPQETALSFDVAMAALLRGAPVPRCRSGVRARVGQRRIADQVY